MTDKESEELSLWEFVPLNEYSLPPLPVRGVAMRWWGVRVIWHGPVWGRRTYLLTEDRELHALSEEHHSTPPDRAQAAHAFEQCLRIFGARVLSSGTDASTKDSAGERDVSKKIGLCLQFCHLLGPRKIMLSAGVSQVFGVR